MRLRGKQVIVVGMGRSGVAAAKLCIERGAHVTVTDTRPRESLSAAVRDLNVTFACGGHALDFKAADLVVVSPGVPPLPQLEEAAATGVEVIGELELASRFVSPACLAIGGTNGKSTTTALLGHLLTGAGHCTFVGGNFGAPLSEAVGLEWDSIVVEVSSFQLERAPTFRPHVSVLLNITEDHLDRYDDFAQYADAKGNAFVNQTPDDLAIVPFGDALCERQARRGRADLVEIALDGQPGAAEAPYVAGSGWVQKTGSARHQLSPSLQGPHNGFNAAAAIAVARFVGVAQGAMVSGLQTFKGLPHRTEYVGEADGIRFYDDSKGTNVRAAVAAVLGVSEPKVVLIAGGRDKGGSYEALVEALRQRGRAVVLIGEAAERIEAALGDALPCRREATMEAAVSAAFDLADSGDAVLLSPACSSFDMFSTYGERGDAFQAAARALGARKSGRRL